MFSQSCFLPLHDDTWDTRFPFFVFFIVVTCNTATTIPIEPLSEIPAGATTRFIFPTSGSNDEAYLTRPAGPGPFPLRSCFTGTRLDRWAAPDSVVPEAEAFARDLCYAGLGRFASRLWHHRSATGGRSKDHLGELDPLVSVQQTNLLREALKAAKIPTNLLFILITVIGLRRMTSKKNHCLSRRNLRVRLPRCCFLIALRSCFAFGLCLASFAERSCWQLNIDDNPLDEKC